MTKLQIILGSFIIGFVVMILVKYGSTPMSELPAWVYFLLR